MNLRILQLAELEVTAAAFWYDAQRPGLGDEFLSALQASLVSIKDTPHRYVRAGFYEGASEVRHCSLSRFPYLVIFQVTPMEILVLAISHARRKPLYWLDRFDSPAS